MISPEEADRVIPIMRCVLRVKNLWTPSDRRSPFTAFKDLVTANAAMFGTITFGSIAIDRLPSCPLSIYCNFGANVTALNIVRLGFCRYLIKNRDSPIILTFDPIFQKLGLKGKFEGDYGDINNDSAAVIGEVLEKRYGNGKLLSSKNEGAESKIDDRTNSNGMHWIPFSDNVAATAPESGVATRAAGRRNSLTAKRAGTVVKAEKENAVVNKRKKKQNLSQIPHVGECEKDGYVQVSDSCDCWYVYLSMMNDMEGIFAYRQFKDHKPDD